MVMSDSGLRGLGGAGFPTGTKWNIVRSEPKPRLMAVNADEGEPGTFKDRTIMNGDPHRLIEGMIISCWANDVNLAYVYIRGEFPEGARILENAIAAARVVNLLHTRFSNLNINCAPATKPISAA